MRMTDGETAGNRFKSDRIIGTKVRKVIVDKDGKIVNRKPNREELICLEEEPYKNKSHCICVYTREELLNYLKRLYEKNGKVPTQRDFINNHGFPGLTTYIRTFGSFQNALKLVELDIESMIKKGIVETEHQKGRLGEIIIRDHFEKYPIDLAGENHNSYCDGICPNGKTYDVKSSGLNFCGSYYMFNIRNKYREEIELYYFLAFSKNYTKLDYAWRVPGKIVEKERFYVGLEEHYNSNIKNMEGYEITDKLRVVLGKYGF